MQLYQKKLEELQQGNFQACAESLENLFQRLSTLDQRDELIASILKSSEWSQEFGANTLLWDDLRADTFNCADCRSKFISLATDKPQLSRRWLMMITILPKFSIKFFHQTPEAKLTQLLDSPIIEAIMPIFRLARNNFTLAHKTECLKQFDKIPGGVSISYHEYIVEGLNCLISLDDQNFTTILSYSKQCSANVTLQHALLVLLSLQKNSVLQFLTLTKNKNPLTAIKLFQLFRLSKDISYELYLKALDEKVNTEQIYQLSQHLQYHTGQIIKLYTDQSEIASQIQMFINHQFEQQHFSTLRCFMDLYQQIHTASDANKFLTALMGFAEKNYALFIRWAAILRRNVNRYHQIILKSQELMEPNVIEDFTALTQLVEVKPAVFDLIFGLSQLCDFGDNGFREKLKTALAWQQRKPELAYNIASRMSFTSLTNSKFSQDLLQVIIQAPERLEQQLSNTVISASAILKTISYILEPQTQQAEGKQPPFTRSMDFLPNLPEQQRNQFNIMLMTNVDEGALLTKILDLYTGDENQNNPVAANPELALQFLNFASQSQDHQLSTTLFDHYHNNRENSPLNQQQIVQLLAPENVMVLRQLFAISDFNPRPEALLRKIKTLEFQQGEIPQNIAEEIHAAFHHSKPFHRVDSRDHKAIDDLKLRASNYETLLDRSKSSQAEKQLSKAIFITREISRIIILAHNIFVIDLIQPIQQLIAEIFGNTHSMTIHMNWVLQQFIDREKIFASLTDIKLSSDQEDSAHELIRLDQGLAFAENAYPEHAQRAIFNALLFNLRQDDNYFSCTGTSVLISMQSDLIAMIQFLRELFLNNHYKYSYSYSNGKKQIIPILIRLNRKSIKRTFFITKESTLIAHPEKKQLVQLSDLQRLKTMLNIPEHLAEEWVRNAIATMPANEYQNIHANLQSLLPKLLESAKQYNPKLKPSDDYHQTWSAYALLSCYDNPVLRVMESILVSADLSRIIAVHNAVCDSLLSMKNQHSWYETINPQDNMLARINDSTFKTFTKSIVDVFMRRLTVVYDLDTHHPQSDITDKNRFNVVDLENCNPLTHHYIATRGSFFALVYRFIETAITELESNTEIDKNQLALLRDFLCALIFEPRVQNKIISQFQAHPNIPKEATPWEITPGANALTLWRTITISRQQQAMTYDHDIGNARDLLQTILGFGYQHPQRFSPHYKSWARFPGHAFSLMIGHSSLHALWQSQNPQTWLEQHFFTPSIAIGNMSAEHLDLNKLSLGLVDLMPKNIEPISMDTCKQATIAGLRNILLNKYFNYAGTQLNNESFEVKLDTLFMSSLHDNVRNTITVLQFADSNYMDENSMNDIHFALIANPFSLKTEIWTVNQDDSNLRKQEQSKYFNKEPWVLYRPV